MTVPSPQRLSGRVAVVTGAASGLGRGGALRFAAEGAAVVCADLDGAGADAVAEEIRDSGGRATGVQVDVTSRDDQEQMATGALDAFGAIHVVYASAGVHGEGTALATDEEAWNRVIGVDLTGVWLTARATLPAVIDAGGGSIITQASISSFAGLPNQVAYAAAKGGVAAMTRQLAADYAPHGVRVNAICPATVPTPLVEAAYLDRAGGDRDLAASMLDRAAGRYPLGRVGRVDDIASLAAFLASDESSWITGGIHVVDGGFTSLFSTVHAPTQMTS